jgi:hypothetical protein
VRSALLFSEPSLLPPALPSPHACTRTASRGSRKTLGNFVKATFQALSHTYGFLSPDLWEKTKYTKSPLQVRGGVCVVAVWGISRACSSVQGRAHTRQALHTPAHCQRQRGQQA